MKRFAVSIALLAAAAAPGWAQQWEFGGAGGAGFLNTVSVASSLAAATSGFKTGLAGSAFFGQNMGGHFGGEVRYAYLQSDLQLKNGGSQATFSGQSHAIHYDLIVHTTRARARTQFFAAIGGGVKIFRGTGTEAAYQPLSQFGYFTKTQVLKPMGDVGVGVKIALGHHLFLRTEVRDYITAFPTEVITPPDGVKYGRLLHDLVPLVGISGEF